MSEIFKLFRLQQLDSHLDQNRSRLHAIETALSQDAALEQARQHASQTAADLEEARKFLRRAEEEVRSQRVKIEQTEATLYGGRVRNPKELQDLQNEAAALKRYLSVLEDRQLELMITLEEVEEKHQQAAAALDKETRRNYEQNHSLLAEQAALSIEVKRFEQDRQAAAQAVPGDEMTLYESLRKTRRGLAVARVADTNCAACGTELSATLLHSARTQNQLIRCSTCGRILYAG